MTMNYNVRQLHKRFDKIERTLDMIERYANPNHFTLSDLFNNADSKDELVVDSKKKERYNYKTHRIELYDDNTYISGAWLSSLVFDGILERIGTETRLWKHKEYLRGEYRTILEEIEVGVYKVVKSLTDYKVEIIASI